MKAYSLLVVLLLCAAVSGCGSRVIKTEDGAPPVYRMDDGSLCKAPAGYRDILESSGTQQARELFLASTLPVVTSEGVKDLPSLEEIDAALYISCGEYAARDISKDVLRHHRDIYQQLRLRYLALGVQSWLDAADGYEAPGKICSFIFNGDQPDARNRTRLVPQETTADDCAVHVNSNGGTHVLLGCSAGRWKIHWAPQRILASPNGWANRRDSLAGTRYVPNPDCGWG